MKLPDSSYVVEIDEEGYPLFSGIRSSDSDLNAALLKNMKRSDPVRLSSRLMTAFPDGKQAWVDAFDDPLVVQSVDRSGPELKLNFLGGYQLPTAIRDLEIDAFDRYHVFLTDQKIPAVFSRKAQAALLHSEGIEKELSDLRVYRSSESPAESPEFWNGLFDSGEDLWELGQVNPAISRRFDRLKHFGVKRVVVPAAGRGNEAQFFESKGLQVTAVDFSKRAKEEFHKRYPLSKLTYELADALAVIGRNEVHWNAVCEHTFYCAIPPAERKRYWESMAAGLKTGSVIFGVYYLKTHSGGPPYGTTQWEIREFSKRAFEIMDWEIANDSVARRAGEELWVILRRR